MATPQPPTTLVVADGSVIKVREQIARLIRVNPTGALGRRLVARVMSRI